MARKTSKKGKPKHLRWIIVSALWLIITVVYPAEIQPEFHFAFKTMLSDLLHDLMALFRFVNFELYRFIGLAVYVTPLLMLDYQVRVHKKKIGKRQTNTLIFHHALILFFTSLFLSLYGYFNSDFVTHIGGWLGNILVQSL